MENKKVPRIKILVACHKADPNIRCDDMYMPIQVGKALYTDLDLGFQGDNTGDNISEKNGSYCELTALYWGWKNLKNIDYIGLAHYRRYLDLESQSQKVDKLLRKYDILIPPPKVLPRSVFEELVLWTSMENVYIFLDTILKLHPNYYDEIVNYFFNNNKFTICNMLLTSTKLFQEYCAFIFPILKETEKRVLSLSHKRQQRVFGYLAESAIGLWLQHKKLSVKTIPMITDEKCGKIKKVLNDFRFNLSFKLSKRLSSTSEIQIYLPVITGLKQEGISISLQRP